MNRLILALSILAALPGLAGCVTRLACQQMPDGQFACDADLNTVGM